MSKVFTESNFCGWYRFLQDTKNRSSHFQSMQVFLIMMVVQAAAKKYICLLNAIFK